MVLMYGQVRPDLALPVLFAPAGQHEGVNTPSLGNLPDLNPFLIAHLNGTNLELVRILPAGFGPSQ